MLLERVEKDKKNHKVLAGFKKGYLKFSTIAKKKQNPKYFFYMIQTFCCENASHLYTIHIPFTRIQHFSHSFTQFLILLVFAS
jgi:hypothetical protein